MPICQLIHLALNIHFKRLCLFHGNLDQANPSRFKINGLIATIEAKKSELFRARNYRQCWLKTNSIHCSKQKINIQKMARNVTNDYMYKCMYQNMSVMRIYNDGVVEHENFTTTFCKTWIRKERRQEGMEVVGYFNYFLRLIKLLTRFHDFEAEWLVGGL